MDSVSYYYACRRGGAEPLACKVVGPPGAPLAVDFTAPLRIAAVETVPSGPNLQVYRVRGEIVVENAPAGFQQVLAFAERDTPAGRRATLAGDVFYWLPRRLAKR